MCLLEEVKIKRFLKESLAKIRKYESDIFIGYCINYEEHDEFIYSCKESLSEFMHLEKYKEFLVVLNDLNHRIDLHENKIRDYRNF